MRNFKFQISNFKLKKEHLQSAICNLKLPAGFTLVEMLVAVSIFSVVIIASTDIFIRAQRAQRQAAALEKVQDTTRFLLSRIAQELQTGSVDYAYYKNKLTTDSKTIISTDATIMSETLAIKSTEGTTTIFTVRRLGDTDFGGLCNTTSTSPCLIIAEASPGTAHERATPDGYTIQKLAFFITPAVDPLHVDPQKNDYPADTQPKVTILLSVRGDVPGIRTPLELSVQTTLSSRAYVR